MLHMASAEIKFIIIIVFIFYSTVSLKKSYILLHAPHLYVFGPATIFVFTFLSELISITFVFNLSTFPTVLAPFAACGVPPELDT